MGTRHLIAVVKDNEFKVAQYGQWDGYPSGQGAAVLSFLRTPGNLQRLTEGLANVRFATEEDHDRINAAAGIPEGSQFMTMEQANTRSEMAPGLSRDTSAKVLDLIADSTEEVLVNDQHEFAGESLFCEWAYVVDLDTNTFEAHVGFQKVPHTDGRFADYPRAENQGVASEYYPVRLMATWPLDSLPEQEAFEKICYGIERSYSDEYAPGEYDEDSPEAIAGPIVFAGVMSA